jgi:hypothetical protein
VSSKKENEMNKTLSFVLGMTLVFIGGAAIVFNFIGWEKAALLIALVSLKSWPGLVILTGLAFCIAPFLFARQRGLSGLFIPGLPILATGILLFLANTFNAWQIWAYLWPVEILALAAGFVLMAIFMRIIWLAIPALWIGLNGLALQFTALFHIWNWWAVLWTVEVLAAGLTLMIVAIGSRSRAAAITGLAVCGLAGLLAGFMVLVLTHHLGLIVMALPVMAILCGIGLVGLGLKPRMKAEV